MENIQRNCPYCGSERTEEEQIYTTQNHGDRVLYKCMDCRKVFSETKGTFLENIKTPVSVISKVFTARSEGLAFNATCRTFKIGRDTLTRWEKKFAKLRTVLFIYSLIYTFLKQEIEGDEFYTKVGKNVPIEECEGWTIVLMDRASRFIWDIKCGKKDSRLFNEAIQTLTQVIEQTNDITLLTDGERRYGNILFDICHEILRVGKRGRPPKVLRKGVKVRLKNKGDQDHKSGPGRPKYEAPHREHPETTQDISDEDIHANHVEAFNGSTRRRNSAFRRKTNTYAKTRTTLQRTLDVLWVIHNFIRPHFTTKEVPAVALGIIKKALSWKQSLMIQVPVGVF